MNFNLKSIIPNGLTVLNLLCGCLGIVFAFKGELHWSSYCIGTAVVFDFFDGFTARLLKVNGELGKQLDSLADMVTFGVLPSVILFQMISIATEDYFTSIANRQISNLFFQFSAFLIAAFSALRLAKFNIDTNQSDKFIGMPTPAGAIFIGSLPLILSSFNVNMYVPIAGKALSATANLYYWSPVEFYTISTLQNKWFLTVAGIIDALLLVAPIEMIALKFKNYSWKDNKLKYSFLAVSTI
ncbi:MAG: hypothetical protein D6707_09975, partial [Bacteroidetes bacterium]